MKADKFQDITEHVGSVFLSKWLPKIMQYKITFFNTTCIKLDGTKIYILRCIVLGGFFFLVNSTEFFTKIQIKKIKNK